MHNSKGIDPLIGVIILTILTISLTGGMLFWGTETTEEFAETTETQREGSMLPYEASFYIKEINNSAYKVTIKNNGKVDLDTGDFYVYLNDSLVDSTPDPIAILRPGETMNLYLSQSPQNCDVKIYGSHSTNDEFYFSQIVTTTPSTTSSLTTSTSGSTTSTTTSITTTTSSTTTSSTTTTIPSGNIYFVATTGNDANPGTIDRPFRTIQKGVDKATAGYTVYIRGGTYNERVNVHNSGTLGNPITIAGYPGETAIVDGTGIDVGTEALINIGYYGQHQESYLTFNNLVIQNTVRGIVNGWAETGFSNPSHDVTISYCTFKNIKYGAITFWQERSTTAKQYNLLISYCTFDNIQYGQNTGECVTFQGAKDSKMEYNKITNCYKIALGICDCSNTVVDHNDVDTSKMVSGAVGIYNDGGQYDGAHSTGVTFSNNYVHGPGQLMGYCNEKGSSSTTDHLTMVNNILIGTDSSSRGIVQFNNAGLLNYYSDIAIKHNTIYLPSGGTCIGLSAPTSYSTNIVVANNILYGGTAYYIATSNRVVTNNLNTNPMFTNTGTGAERYKLQSGSPAINAGTSAYTTTYDFDGKVRVSPPDIGAYEYGNGGTTTTSTTTTTGSCNICTLGTPVITPSSPASGQSFNISCPSSPWGNDCTWSFVDTTQCTWIRWSGSSTTGGSAIFTCPPQPSGSHTAVCKSVTGTSDNCCASEKTLTFTIGGTTTTTSSTTTTIPSTSSRIQKMSICYSGRIFLPAQQQYIALHFDLVDTDPAAASQIQSMKIVNPNLKAIGYFDSVFDDSSHPEDWYVHRSGTTTRVTSSSSSSLLVMNTNPSKGWVNYYITRAKGLSSVYDGIFLDDYWYDPTYDNAYWSVAPSSWEVSMSNWKTWMVQFAGSVKSNLGSKIAMPNVPLSTGAVPAVCDQSHAVFVEHFVHKLETSVTDNGRSASNILSSIDQLHTQAAKGDIIAVVSGSSNDGTSQQYEEWAKFCYACFAFAAEDLSKAYFAWNFMGSSPTTNPTWYSWMDTELGAPESNYQKIADPYVYERTFANYYVIANLDNLGTSKTFTFSGKSYTLEGKHALLIQKSPTTTTTSTTTTMSSTTITISSTTTTISSGNIYYVSTSGSDSNPGTITQPFKTIQKGVDVAQAGDAVYVRAGTYYGRLVMKNSGTAGKPITITGMPGESKPILDGQGTTHWQGMIYLNSKRYITFNNLIIQNSGAHGLYTTWENIPPSTDITVTNCDFKNMFYYAILFFAYDSNNPCYRMKVTNCTFDNIEYAYHTTGTTQECVGFGKCYNCEFSYNKMTHIHKIGFDFGANHNSVAHHNDIDVTDMSTEAYGIYVIGGHTAGSYSDNIEIYDNYVHGNRQLVGIGNEEETGAWSQNVKIYNNILVPTASNYHAITLFNMVSGCYFKDIKIYHNTVYAPNGARGITMHGMSSSEVSGLYIANNIFSGSRTDLMSTVNPTVITNNLFYSTSGTATGYGTNYQIGNPNLVNLGTDFHLTSASTLAIDKASSAYSTSTDFDGKSRPQGAGYDIGAYEYGSGTTGQVTVYVTKAITDTMILPSTSLSSSYINNTINVRTAPGEYVPATFTVKSSTAMSSFKPVVSNLVKGTATIPASNVDIKIVKCWYQMSRETYPSGYVKLFVPELLLNNDALVRVTYTSDTSGKNELLVGSSYVDISSTSSGGPRTGTNVVDATTLQPLSLSANKNQQYWVTVYVPKGTAPGTYTGTISLTNGGTSVGTITLNVDVLPFTLPASPKTISMYFSQPTVTSTPRLDSYLGRSPEQLAAIFASMKKHGLTNPHAHVAYSDPTFNQYMKIRADAGMDFDPFFYKGEYLKDLTPSQVTTLVNNIKNWFKTTGVSYGIPIPSTIYFYPVDEEDAVPYASQINACHAAGGKTFAALGGSSSCTYIKNALNYPSGPLIDLTNNCYPPTQYACLLQAITDYHNKGLKVGIYGAPQCGEEKPFTYRRNYGLNVWKYDYDTSQDYAYDDAAGSGCCWNDFQMTSSPWYKFQGMEYPTSNDVVTTVQFEGFREGVNDLRYISKLQTVLSSAPSSTTKTQATSYLSNLKASGWDSTADLDSIRNDVINFIIALS